MREPRDVHRGATLVLSGAMFAVGVAMLVVTLAAGGGILALGVILGVLFTAAGAGRLYFTWRQL
jgi:IMP dehydrogenase/GMP reductase